MKKTALIIFLTVLILSLSILLSACEGFDLQSFFDKFTGSNNGEVTPTQLKTPIPFIDDNNVARWEKDDNALCYTYRLNDLEYATQNTYVALKPGDTFSVKADGDGDKYLDSEWSLPMTCQPDEFVCDHVFENDCDSTCNVCDYTRKTSHVFENDCDETCGVCGETRQISHTFTNDCDPDCNVCGYTRDISHSFDNDCDTKCNVCDFTRIVTHFFDNDCDPECNVCRFTRQTTHVFANDCDTECNRCGFTRDTQHQGGTATCVKQAICSICGEGYGDFANHNWGDFSYTATNHFKSCTVCGEKAEEGAHEWNVLEPSEEIGKFCTICSFVASPPLSHVHQGVYQEYVAPTCTQSGRAIHYLCDCGQLFLDEYCEQPTDLVSITLAPLGHSYENFYSYDHEGHYFQCVNCGEKDTIIPHTYTNACDTTCNGETCEYVRETTHSPLSTDGDCTKPITCSICLVILSEGQTNHTFTNACDSHCNFAGCNYSRPVSHTPSPDDGNCETPVLCSVCFEIVIEGKEHSFTNACDTTCNNDGCEYSRTTTHTPETDDGNCETPVLCSVCSEIAIEGKEHSFTNGCDTTCNNQGCNYTQEVSHKDDNGDGKCDNCNSGMSVTINIYGMNDLHGVLCDSDYTGMGKFSTYMHNLYKDDSAYEILISQGDMWQGTAESSTNQGALMTEWMNYMNFSAMTLGNHEYDWGSSFIQSNANLANFPFLGINVSDANASTPYCQPSVVVERGGVKIGIIGAIGNCLSSISAQFTHDGSIKFAVYDYLTNMVKAESERLREEEGCHFIAYVLHDGYGSSGNYNLSGSDFVDSDGNLYYDTSLSNGYVDIVFESHSHQNYVIQDEYGVYHLQGGGNGQYMSKANLVFDLQSGKVEVAVEKLSHSTFSASSIQKDPMIDQLYAKYFDADNDPYTQIVGVNDEYRSKAVLLQKLADLYYEKGVEVWGNDYDIILGGGYMSCRGSGLSAGNVTYAQIFKNLPFDNALVLCKASGSTVLNKFINSTNSNYYIYSAVSESSISSSGTYYIVTDAYSAWYSYNNLEPIAILEGEIFARDLIKDYIASGAWGGVAQPITLTAPTLSISSSGLASWSSVTGAVGYRYILNGGDAISTTATSLQLENGDSIKVMAVGNGSSYLDSAYGSEKTFTKAQATLSTIAEILAEGALLADGEQTEIEFTVCGVITSVVQPTYGNMYIQDDAGNTLYVYGVYDETGNKYGELSVKPVVGDTITLKGVIKNYGGTIELYQTVIVEHIPA